MGIPIVGPFVSFVIASMAKVAARPWLFISVTFGIITKWQDIKTYGDIAGLALTGKGVQASCQLCNVVTDKVLKNLNVHELKKNKVNCKKLCFGVGTKCQKTCNAIIGSMQNSTAYPCEAMGACPKLDEFGELNCIFSVKTMGCTPKEQCKFTFPNKW